MKNSNYENGFEEDIDIDQLELEMIMTDGEEITNT